MDALVESFSGNGLDALITVVQDFNERPAQVSGIQQIICKNGEDIAAKLSVGGHRSILTMNPRPTQGPDVDAQASAPAPALGLEVFERGLAPSLTAGIAAPSTAEPESQPSDEGGAEVEADVNEDAMKQTYTEEARESSTRHIQRFFKRIRPPHGGPVAVAFQKTARTYGARSTVAGANFFMAVAGCMPHVMAHMQKLSDHANKAYARVTLEIRVVKPADHESLERMMDRKGRLTCVSQCVKGTRN